MAKILLVDDDEDLSFTVCDFLTRDGHVVDGFATGGDGTEALKQTDYDIIILDLGLPDMTGFDVLRTYRTAGGQAPVIILTGQAELDSKLTGLDLGADDYLTKPFHVLELAARIRSVLRRPRQTVATVFQLGALSLDTGQHLVTKNGVEIKLRPKDFALLEFFMRHPNQVFSTESLLARVWTYEDSPTADGLRTAINRIRRAIDGPDDLDNSYIENISRVGYRMRSTSSKP